MSQIRRSSCNVLNKEFGLKLGRDLIPPDLGHYTVDLRPLCIDNLGIRRHDVGKPSWGNSGFATMDTVRAFDTPGVLAKLDTRPIQTIATEQGPIRLGRGADADGSYTPSAATLNLLPYSDTRRTAISDRYYR